MYTRENVSGLVEEYRALFGDADTHSSDHLQDILTREGEWTEEGAAQLLQLVKTCGSFMLRNALAISLVLEIEDGELGF
jgi:hypothetical protein